MATERRMIMLSELANNDEYADVRSFEFEGDSTLYMLDKRPTVNTDTDNEIYKVAVIDVPVIDNNGDATVIPILDTLIEVVVRRPE